MDVVLSWQVSWLAGQRFDPPSRNFRSSGMMDFSSPLTVAGAAPVLQDYLYPHA
ncbi:hypothetical protein CES85_5297 [Ochrobactrum quorumnocens]|uniref:Uncharacterized protein n=1 Tax=Ochrobactrum quorumnocens TaxID=271865 RepID=A0A248UCF9_9HYPH|nr:hypothetical protein CES85_5297 [[Ochrobactrum] quorumnocens]